MEVNQMQEPDNGVIIISEREALVEYTLHELRRIKRITFAVLLLEIANLALMIVKVFFNA